MRKYLFILLMGMSLTLAAQDKIPVTERDYQNSGVEMADAMRAEGKIYVVVAVLATIFAGIVVYAVRIDQKVSRLEKEVYADKISAKFHA